MYRRIRKLVWPHRERLLSLVMLPAFFLATLPHTACICADGHREPSCNALACHARASESSKSSCCKDCGSNQKRSCCKNHGSKPSKQDSIPASGLVSTNGSCCHPIIEAPAPAIATNKAKQTSDSVIAAIIHPLRALAATVVVRPSLDRIHSSTPLPLDAVIVYLHLTI